MDNISRFFRQLMPMLMNNKGFLRINRDPDGGDGGGGDGGDGSGGDGGDGGDGGSGGQANEFFNSIPEEVRKSYVSKEGKSTFEKFDSLEGMAKSYGELEKKISAKGVLLPGENAKPEEIAEFNKALGVPDAPDGYKFTPVENVHKAVGNVTEISQGLANFLHSKGAPPKLADAIHSEFIGLLSKSAELQEENQTKAMQTSEAELRKAWGAQYDDNKARLDKFVKASLKPEEIQALGGDEGILNNPVASKLLHAAVSRLGEDTLRTILATPTTKDGGTQQQAEAKKSYDAIMAGEGELGKALWDESNPKHSEAIKEKQRLAEIIYPEEANV